MTSHTASAVPFVDVGFLVQQRAELTARRAAYVEQVARLAAAVDELASASGAPDSSDDQGFAQADPINVERDHLVSLRARARTRLGDVESALLRLDTGTYGACRTCRRPVPVARLEAVPEASQCVACAGGSALRRR